MLASLIDHYLAITRAVWHCAKAKGYRVVLCLLVPIISLLSLMAYFINQTVIIATTLLILSLLCILGHIIVYYNAWQLIPQPTTTVQVPLLLPKPKAIQQDDGDAVDGDKTPPPAPVVPDAATAIDPETATESTASKKVTTMAVHMTRSARRRMKTEMTQSFLIAVIPLVLISLPFPVYSLIVNLLLLDDSDCADNVVCSDWIFFLYKWTSFHTVVHSVTHLLANKELAPPPPQPFYNVLSHNNRQGFI